MNNAACPQRLAGFLNRATGPTFLLMALLLGCVGKPAKVAPRFHIAVVGRAVGLQNKHRVDGAQRAAQEFPDLALSYLSPTVSISQQLRHLLATPPDALILYPPQLAPLRPLLWQLRERGTRIVLAGLGSLNAQPDDYHLRIAPLGQQQFSLQLWRQLRDREHACILVQAPPQPDEETLIQRLLATLPQVRILTTPPVDDGCDSLLVMEEQQLTALIVRKMQVHASWQLLAIGSPTPLLLSHIQTGTLNWLLDPAEYWTAYAAVLAGYGLLEKEEAQGTFDLLQLGSVPIAADRTVNLELATPLTPDNVRDYAFNGRALPSP